MMACPSSEQAAVACPEELSAEYGKGANILISEGTIDPMLCWPPDAKSSLILKGSQHHD